MMVFIEKHLVFLSMPKMASTAFIAALTPYTSMMIKEPRFCHNLKPISDQHQHDMLRTSIRAFKRSLAELSIGTR